MRIYLTRGTKFVRDGKTVKAADFHDGDPVTADATRDARLNLLAVKIEAKIEVTKSDGKTDKQRRRNRHLAGLVRL